MCTTETNKGESILLRSYKMPGHAMPVSLKASQRGVIENMSISVAARATSAAPTYLPEVLYNKLRFWDGGLLNNNPINQLWNARYDLVSHSDPAPPVSCVLSIGTSWSTATSWSTFRLMNTVTTAASFVTNTEAKDVDFHRLINRLRGRPGPEQNVNYFRFNAPTGKESFNLDDYRKMPRLVTLTTEWVKKPEIAQKIRECAESLL